MDCLPRHAESIHPHLALQGYGRAATRSRRSRDGGPLAAHPRISREAGERHSDSCLFFTHALSQTGPPGDDPSRRESCMIYEMRMQEVADPALRDEYMEVYGQALR